MGISYLVETRTPTYKLDSVDSINALPLTTQQAGGLQLLANVATVERGVTQEVANHTNVQPTFDVYANVQGRDLGSVAREINDVLDEYRAKLAAGDTITMRGPVETMDWAVLGLELRVNFVAV